jgi:SAM-dependent methyltransferase
MRTPPLRAQVSRYRAAAGRRAKDVVRRVRGRPSSDDDAAAVGPPQGDYESRYEAHARASDIHGVGGGDFDRMGATELDILRGAGMEPSHTLVDFGCGNGRLAVHAVPYLCQGRYVGIDISRSFLADAGQRLAAVEPSGCEVRLLHQNDETFDLPDGSVDYICAYSVFTHMDHEDLYRYLVAMRRILRPDGRLLISCLPLDLEDARDIFLNECGFDPVARWDRVRNVTTSQDLVDSIAMMAGWSVRRWLPGDRAQATDLDGQPSRLGQSVVVLAPA